MKREPIHPGISVLLFEPDLKKRSLHGMILLTHGYRTETTGNEADAHEICETMRPDLVLVGACTPLSDTFDVYDRFRTRHTHCRVAFVPGELKLSDLYCDGDLIRKTGALDFAGDIAAMLAPGAELEIQSARSASAGEI